MIWCEHLASDSDFRGVVEARLQKNFSVEVHFSAWSGLLAEEFRVIRGSAVGVMKKISTLKSISALAGEGISAKGKGSC